MGSLREKNNNRLGALPQAKILNCALWTLGWMLLYGGVQFCTAGHLAIGYVGWTLGVDDSLWWGAVWTVGHLAGSLHILMATIGIWVRGGYGSRMSSVSVTWERLPLGRVNWVLPSSYEMFQALGSSMALGRSVDFSEPR